MLNSEIGRYQMQDRLRAAQKERIAASVATSKPTRRIQRISSVFGSVKARKPAAAPAPRVATVG